MPDFEDMCGGIVLIKEAIDLGVHRVQGSVQRLEDSGEESNQALANRCKLDLAKAGFNVPAAPGTDEITAGQ